MNKKTRLTCILILLLNMSFACAAQLLRATPEKVELGNLNTFQVKEAIVKLENAGNETFLVDKIKADCACIRTSISKREILPGQAVELKIAAKERTGGKFSHDILIIPKDKEHQEPLKIQASGNAIQPVSAKIGWEGKEITTFDPNRPVDLGLVHHLSAKPVIHIIADDKHFNIREAILDVNSTFFELYKHTFEKLAASDHLHTSEQVGERLILLLKPKEKLKIGALRDGIRIKLADNVGVEIPISCRIVGDVYAKERIIHFGDFSDSTPKKFTIHSINDSKIWPDVKWNVSGYLSDAVVITKDDNESTNSFIGLTLAVNQSKLNSLPRGYVFCRIEFFQKQPTDNEVISILLDGFNRKSGI